MKGEPAMKDEHEGRNRRSGRQVGAARKRRGRANDTQRIADMTNPWKAAFGEWEIRPELGTPSAGTTPPLDERGDVGPSWNWWAGVFGPFWYLRHGMWARACAHGAVILLLGWLMYAEVGPAGYVSLWPLNGIVPHDAKPPLDEES